MKSLWHSGWLGKLIVLFGVFFAGSIVIALAIQLLQLIIRIWAYIGLPAALAIGLSLYKSMRVKHWFVKRLPDLAAPLSKFPGLTSSAIATLFASSALVAYGLLPIGQTLNNTAPTQPAREIVSAAEEIAPTPTVVVIAKILPTATSITPPTPQASAILTPSTALQATATLVPIIAPTTQETATSVPIEPAATSTRRPRPRPVIVVQPSATANIVPLEPVVVAAEPTAIPTLPVPPTLPPPALVELPQPAPEQPVEAQPNGARTGAICRDGSHSSATGRGACSHHGGVDHWLY